MNTIEKLIAELCPNGVEFKELWEVTNWDKRFNAVDNKKQKTILSFKHISAKSLKKIKVEKGNVKLLATGIFDGWTTELLAEENINNGEIISIPSGGSVSIKYYKGKFVDSGNILASSANDSILNLKYCYYFLLIKKNLIEKCFRGAGIKHPNMSEILKIKIPLPPLPIQLEIVRILDIFTQLEAKLEAELEARKSQYEYYRDEMLSFGDDEVEWKPLGEVYKFQYGMGNTIPTIGGEYPVYGSNGMVGTHNEFNSEDSPVIGHIGAYAGIVNWGKGKHFVTYNGVICRLIVTDVNPKYAYYQLLKQDFNSMAKNEAQPFVSYGELNKVQIPIPTPEKQQQIVAILDKFDALVNDISIGLPAELLARRQQYEYYREQLLTFKDLNNK